MANSHPGAVTAPSNSTRAPWVVLILGGCSAMICAPYWLAHYSDVRSDGILGYFRLIVLVVFGGAALLTAVRACRARTAILAMILPVLVAVIGRVVLDTDTFPDSHSMWPLEVVVAEIVTLPLAALGALLGIVIRQMTQASES